MEQAISKLTIPNNSSPVNEKYCWYDAAKPKKYINYGIPLKLDFSKTAIKALLTHSNAH